MKLTVADSQVMRFIKPHTLHQIGETEVTNSSLVL